MVQKILFRKPPSNAVSIPNRMNGYCMEAIYSIPNGLRMMNKPRISALPPALAVACSAVLALSAKADVTVTGDQPRHVEIPVDYGALGSETSNAAMQCWQEGKEIFSAEDYNTVLLGGLAGETAITLKSNQDGAQTLAISLEDGLCFVTIEP